METLIEDWWRDALDVQILAVGRLEIGAWWRFDFTSGTSPWRIYLNNRAGAALEFVAGDRFEIPANVVTVVPPGLRFSTRAWAPVTHAYVHFGVVGMPRLPLHLVRRPFVLAAATGARQLLHEIFEHHLEHPRRLELQWRLKAVVYDVLARVISQTRAPADGELEDLALRYGQIRFALRKIQDQYAERLSNADLARVCNMSEDHFIRTFRAEMGVTPTQYLVDFRVRQVAVRLAATSESLDQIAEQTGFGSRSYLSRQFRQRMGVSPQTYRTEATQHVEVVLPDAPRRPLATTEPGRRRAAET
ncbi:MAG: AraC family transcriptional regulator [Fimbriimonadaceae bacterium]|nr:AraC family transcriptional regulator [Fimbriimonadaceae bacterium]